MFFGVWVRPPSGIRVWFGVKSRVIGGGEQVS